MKSRTYIRLLLFMLIVSVSFILFSYSRSDKNRTAAPGQKSPDCSEKCEHKKAQTEFILWESLTRNLLSVNR